MKKLIVATTAVLGLTCVVGVSVAQDQTQATEMQNITVTGVRMPYEVYTANLDTGYQLQTLVGHTHKKFMQAQRAADQSESLRKRGISIQPVVAVAIDNSSGPGVARQIQLIDSGRNTVAIVNVYCKRVVPSGGPRCRLAPLPMQNSKSGERLAATQPGYLQVASVDLPK